MKRNGIPLVFTLALISLLIASCENNNEVDLYGIEPCETDNLTWEGEISAIFDTYCVPCHKESLNYENVRHDSFEEEMKVIAEGDDRLRDVINHRDVYERMPFERPKLSNCNILKIETWLDIGAPEK